jgi:hypothetical protein
VSAAQKFRAASRMLFGALNAGAAAYFLFLEMQGKSPHTANVMIFVGWIAFGWAIVTPSLFFGNVKQILGLLPSVSISGGRRSTDPPVRPNVVLDDGEDKG